MGPQNHDSLHCGEEAFLGQGLSPVSVKKSKRKRETVSWQFFFPSAGGDKAQTSGLFHFLARPFFFIPVAFMVGYVAFMSPVKILGHMPLLFPGWSGIQAVTQKSPEFVKPPVDLVQNTILWLVPFLVPVYVDWGAYFDGFQAAPWVRAWAEWWEGERNNMPLSGYMFNPPPSLVAVSAPAKGAPYFDPALPKSYMVEGQGPLVVMDLVDSLGSLEIHKPAAPLLKPKISPIPIAVELPPEPIPQKFMKRVDISKETDVKHFVKQAQRLADHGDLLGAIIAARQAYALAPESLSMIGLLADLYLQSNQSTLFTSFIEELNPTLRDSDTVKVLEARFALMNKDPEEALRVFKTIRTEPLGASQLSVLAAAYQMAGDHELSIQTYWKLLHLKPEDGRAWVGLSISLEAMQDKQNALVGYQKALGHHLDLKVREYVEGRVNRLKASLK